MIKSGYITLEIPTLELVIRDSPPDQSLLSNGSISPDQLLPQAKSSPQRKSGHQVQSLPQAKSVPRVQSLPQSKSGFQDQSLPQDISTQNDLSAGIYVPSHVDWTLHPGPNSNNNALYMWVWSGGDWVVIVQDAESDKPTGKMAEYDYTTKQYVIGGHSLQDPLYIQSGQGQIWGFGQPSGPGPTVSLTEGPREIQRGGPVLFEYFPINLNQHVGPSDYALSQNRGYRIVITFVATTPISPP
jgi:hypothetical protein